MARIFTDPSEDFTRVSLPITKFERQDDGSVLVWGKATDGGLDRDLQIIDPAFARKSLQAWFQTGANIRVMHSPSLYPAGVGVELVSQEDGEWLKARIVEPTAVKLVEAGVLQAYSVGIARPRIIRDQVAKGGRVVDGETVEVSLVDRPANPSCGLVIAKMAGGETPTVEYLSELLGEPDLQKQDNSEEIDTTRKGSSFVEQLPEDVKKSAPEAELTGQEQADVEKADGATPPVGEKVTKADAPDADEPDGDEPEDKKTVEKGVHTADLEVEAGLEHLKDALRQVVADQMTDPDRLTHDADRQVDAALARTGEDIDAAIAAQAADERTDKAAAPDLAKADQLDLTGSLESPTLTPADGVPYGLRRLHDATCAAYSWPVVKEAHPALAKMSLGELLGGASQLINANLARALATDGGTGQAADEVAALAKAYQAAIALGTPDEQLMAQARVELAKAFRAANPDAPAMTPLQTGAGGHQPTPGQWVRPYLSAGHAPLSASAGQHPRLPSAKPVDAAQFGRGPLTDGHQSPSPQNRGPNPSGAHATAAPSRAPGEKGVDAELTKNDPLTIAGSMAAVHDHLADLYPHVCPMDHRYATRQSDINTQPLAQTTVLDTNPAGGPMAAAAPAVTKAATVATGDELLKAASPELLKAAITELVQEQVASQLALQAEKHETELAKMRRQLDELAAQPDPRQAAYRGMAGIEQILPALTKRAEEPPAGANAEQVSRIAAWLDSPDPAQREAARASLLAKLR
ncbi:hypothetical protein ORV05_04940 [Amycolatopsis cynarae]|uniref:Prohead protease n=1 Tax=Amycolatopsis cynarae TaxID=2995223 RepID=A0ABY7B7H3_9PSEU|nr:hypothetical protein [Amycolatopsis sp. HUAS 11-8]WAL67138.1 hypothetical protein ORV05_04940 [Amycolatopsis sp. HUAS 11-8]